MTEPGRPGRGRAADPSLASSGGGLDLRREFPIPTLEDWRREVAAILKGTPFEKAVRTPTAEGIELRGLYTRADTEALDFPRSLPGEAPFTRGAHLLGHRMDPWEIAQEIPLADADAYAEALRQDLAAGQTAAVLVLDAAGRAGLDPDLADPSLVGRGGTSISTLEEMAAALAPVLASAPPRERSPSLPAGDPSAGPTPADSAAPPALAPLLLHARAACLPAAALAGAHLRARGGDLAWLRGSFGADPLSDALAGALVRLDTAYDQLAALTDWLESRTPGDHRARSLVAWGARWREAGGSMVDELAYALGSAVQTLREMESRGVDPRAAATRLLFGFAAGPQPLLEIAKFRAARMLWGRVCDACGFDDPPASMWIHARTLFRNQSRLDPHTNAVRSTIAAVSAILGGCDSLTVLPFDAPLGPPSERSRRLARNTQLVLRDECRLDAVIDAAGGSHAVESVTAEVAEKAWARFREIEAGGGLRRLLEAGEPQARLARSAEAQRQAVATRREVLVGTNQYPDPREPAPVYQQPDFAALHRRRVEELEAHRASRADGPVREALDRLARIQGDERTRARGERFEAAIGAAMAGATLGELTHPERAKSFLATAGAAAPAGAAGASAAGPPFLGLPVHRLAEEFEELRALARGAVRAQATPGEENAAGGTDRTRAAAPVVCLLCFGPAAEYRARLEFARSFFLLAGLDPVAPVSVDDSAGAAAEAARQAAGCGASIAVIVSTDSRYPQLVPAAAAALQRVGSVRAVALAGLPAEAALAEEFRAAGVDEFLHLRCDAPSVLRSLLEKGGGRP